jgi:ParB-like chromosome segregation protein Spo0J
VSKDKVTTIAIKDIRVGRRKRKAEDVSDLVESVSQLGLLQPIVVTADNRLVAGFRRLQACKQLGWTTIPAKIVQLDRLKTELAEIDENLVRQELTELERAEHLTRRKEIYEALGPVIKWGGDRKSEQFKTTRCRLDSFTVDTAAKTGLSRRTVERGVQIGTKIPQDVRDLIRHTPLADQKRELLELARKPEEEQREIAKKIVAGEASKVKEAARLVKREQFLEQAQNVPDRGQLWQVWKADIATWQAPRKYDFIITDPPYGEEYLHLWSLLAQRATEWLADGGMLVAMTGQIYLPRVISVLCEHLEYYWTIALVMRGPASLIQSRLVHQNWKPILCFTKKGDTYAGQRGFNDLIITDTSEKSLHDWQQPTEAMVEIVRRLCRPGQAVLDPFCGSGTTGVAAIRFGCTFHGIDIDPDAVKITRKRLYGETTGREVPN